jgi:hypothetical protein
LRNQVITAYPSNTRSDANRGKGKGGKTRKRSATVAQSRSLKFLNVITSRIGRLRHTAPSLRLFVPNGLTVCHLSFLPWDVLATSVIGVSSGDHSPTATSAPSLDQLVPSSSLISYQQVRVITVIQKIFLSVTHTMMQSFLRFLVSFFQHNHPKIPSISLSHNSGSCNSWSGRFSHISDSYSVRSFFFRFEGGLPLHKIHFLKLCNLREVPTTRFAIFSPKI